MKIKSLTDIVIFRISDLPQMDYDNIVDRSSFSVYKDVLVGWDEDEDDRILKFIDDLPDILRSNLLYAQEHKGCLELLWKKYIPQTYEVGDGVNAENDVWSINTSKCCKNVCDMVEDNPLL